MKISVIVPVFNDTRVERSLDTILSQQHDYKLELIVIDGGSTDGTLKVLENYKECISVFISEPDAGIFDGVNKGIASSSATSDDVVHYLASDDRYANRFVIRDVMEVFITDQSIDACYGDQIYTNKDGKIVRYWQAGEYRRMKLYYGWLPPHPTFFVRKRVYERYGVFDQQHSIAGDSDFMLRVLFKHGVKVKYLKQILVDMAPGGNSGGSIGNIIKGNLEMCRVYKKNNMHGGFLIAVLKPALKLLQLVSRPQ